MLCCWCVLPSLWQLCLHGLTLETYMSACIGMWIHVKHLGPFLLLSRARSTWRTRKAIREHFELYQDFINDFKHGRLRNRPTEAQSGLKGMQPAHFLQKQLQWKARRAPW